MRIAFPIPLGEIATPWFVFSVFYPCATGILAGANMSGDLATPDHSIPRGTLGSIAVALVTYVCIVVFSATSIKQQELADNYYVMQQLCFQEEVIVFAVALAGFLAALSGMMGSARILQQIAIDDLFPTWVRPLVGVHCQCKKHSGAHCEPQNTMKVH